MLYTMLPIILQLNAINIHFYGVKSFSKPMDV